MQLKLSALKSLHVQDRNTILGKLGTFNVEVRRYFSGWTPKLEVKLDSTIIHDNGVTGPERAEFDTLLERAHEEMNKARRDKIQSLQEIAKELYYD